MNDNELAVYEALVRTQVFASNHVSAFPQGSSAPAGFARLQAILEEVGPVTMRKGVSGSAATLAKEHLIDELREDLLAIARTARAIAHKEPGFERNFRIGGDCDRELIAIAEVFVRHLEEPATAAKFVAYDLPAELAANLQADLDAIRQLQDEQLGHRQDFTGSTARVRELMVEGRGLLKGLDASVRNRFRETPEIIAAWITAARIHRSKREANEPAAPVAPAVH